MTKIIDYLKARIAETSSKFGALITAILGACAVANQYGQPWGKIVFGAAMVTPVYLFFKPDPKAVGAPEAAQKVADAAQDAANVAAS